MQREGLPVHSGQSSLGGMGVPSTVNIRVATWHSGFGAYRADVVTKSACLVTRGVYMYLWEWGMFWSQASPINQSLDFNHHSEIPRERQEERIPPPGRQCREQSPPARILLELPSAPAALLSQWQQRRLRQQQGIQGSSELTSVIKWSSLTKLVKHWAIKLNLL